MKKVLICLLGSLMLASCGQDEKTPVLQCGGYDIQMELSSDGDAMHANINGDELDLSHVVAASGAKYAGILNEIVVVLWQKGDAWTLMLDDDQLIECKTK